MIERRSCSKKEMVRDGFTLVELTISLAFISVLSLTVVMVVSSAISSYRKSITLGLVNDAGMNIVDDMRNAVQNSRAFSIRGTCKYVYDGNNSNIGACERNDGRGLASTVRVASLDLGEGVKDVPVYGSFCTGNYSYVWNSGYFDNGKINSSGDGTVAAKATISYVKGDGGGGRGGVETINDIRLLKIKDEDRTVCKVMMGGNYSNNGVINGSNSSFNIPEELSETPVELLSEGSMGLAIYDLWATFAEQDGPTKNIFYYTSFVLGTIEGGVNIMSNANNCKTPADYSDSQNFDYCAINKFNFAAMASGRTGR